MPIVKINEKEYDFDLLSAEAKQQLGSLKFVDAELQRLNAQAAVLQTARIAYAKALQEALPKQASDDTTKKSPDDGLYESVNGTVM